MVRKLSFLVVYLSICFISCNKSLDDFNLDSPDGNLSLEIQLIENRPNYRVLWHGEEMVGFSELEIFPGCPIEVLDATQREQDTTWNPVWGQFSSIRDNFKELLLDINCQGVEGKLIARIYNQGVAFRFILNEGEKPGETTFRCGFSFPEGSKYFTPRGEGEPLGPLDYGQLSEFLKDTTRRKRRISIPLVVESSENSYMALLESDLYAAYGINAMQINVGELNEEFVSENKVELRDNEWVSPWRVVLVGKSAGDLVLNTVPVNLATPCKIEDTDWIKPGKTLWDWRVHGFTAPDGFVYGINSESYFRFIDFAAEYGIDYFLIDDAWYKKVSRGHFELSEQLDLEKVINYSKEKNVDLVLYYDRRHGEYGDDLLFPYYQSLGMKGIKYGFMGSNVPFTRNAIIKSAENKLLIDFHDGPVPYTGIRRTYPNAITREYCHAQQDSRRAFTPESFIKMALINAITGPLDMNNGNFDLKGISSGQRQKGPRKKNSYFSTVTSEAARTLIIFSGLVCLPDAPEAYAAKADLFEFIQKQPVGQWDESLILHSEIGHFITTARRSGKEWFVGSVYNQQGGALDINFDFLEEGLDYYVTFYEDTEETHCRNNQEAYRIRKGTVKKGDVVKAVMAPGGGHCMWIRPVI